MKKKAIIKINKELIIIEIYHPFLRRYSRLTAIEHENSTIEIGDIQTATINMGAGTLLMETLINYAKNNNINCIDGWLSDVDSNHLDRLNHFYKKFGFEIIESKEKGSLRLYDIHLKLK